MKKNFLLIAIVSISFAAMSQKSKVKSALSYIDQGNLNKAKEAIDQALVDKKSKDWFNTYFAKGKLCQAAYESTNEKYKAFYTDPLAEAYASFQKAMELDPKGGAKKKIITNMIYNSLAANLYNQCSTRFEAKDFEGALNSFETLIKITESDLYAGSKDTAIYYNAGLAAVNCNKYNEAIKYFEKCSEMKYMGITPYYLIYQSYLGLGDSIKAESILTGLPKLFPNDKSITLQLIDFYSMSSKFDEAQEYITVAKESDPNNYSLYLAAGIMYLNQNKYDQAISELGKSIELNPELYDTQYSLGAAYINKAVEMFTKANEIMDVKKHTEAIDSANIVYAKALPYLEKAYELNPNDVETMSCLRELYSRLKMTKEYDEIKAKLDAINAQQK